MKIRFVLAALALVTGRLAGAIPENVSGFIYRESRTFGRDSSSQTYLLDANGRFSGLYQYFRTGGNILAPASTLEQSGTYTYRQTDARTAILVFASDTNSSPVTRTLRFDFDTTGLAVASVTTEVLGGSFTLIPIRSSAPLLNCSNRSFVRAGGTAYSGFVLNSFGAVLVRAVGPGLAAFGVRNALRDPKLAVVTAERNGVIAEADDRRPESVEAVRRVGAILGAFPLAENSKDSAMIIQLLPGAYIAQASSVDPTDEGEVLVEVYLLP
ncbi:MAG: hypothetical protein JNL39_03710 [Opitutaceae bacterium]|nr:hypothetical protein [Opitutaceae bacterium]